MTDLERARDVIRKRATVDWDESYVQLGAIRLGSRRSRRTRRIVFASVLVPCAALVMALGWHHRSSPGGGAGGAASAASLASLPPAAPPAFAEKPLRFSDGSLAVPADEKTRVAIADDTPSRMTAELTAGRSRFEVVPSPTRMFTVRTGSVTVIVVGTIFTVDRRDDFVEVSVERGRVRVESPSGQQELGAGESASVRATAIGDPASSPSSRAPQKRSAASAELPTWRALAEQHRFQEAYRLLPEASPAIETPRDLLLAADSARLSGHPGAAVKYLTTIVREYPKDFSAQLAAFSLGSIYLDQLNRPSDAAFRFGQAHALAGMGALSEDALARQVEALGRAGDAIKAHAQAEEYVRLFPSGRHIEMVRRVGGLD